MAAEGGARPKVRREHHSTPFTRREDTSDSCLRFWRRKSSGAALKGGSRSSWKPITSTIRVARGGLGTRDRAEKDQGLAEKGLLTIRAGCVIHHDLPQRTYRIEIN